MGEKTRKGAFADMRERAAEMWSVVIKPEAGKGGNVIYDIE